MNLKAQLQHDREALNLTRKDASRKLGLAQNLIYKHEGQKDASISDLALRKYGYVYKRDVYYYIDQARQEGLYSNKGKSTKLTLDANHYDKSKSCAEQEQEQEPTLRSDSHIELSSEIVILFTDNTASSQVLIRDLELFCTDVASLIENSLDSIAIQRLDTIISTCRKLRAKYGIQLHSK